MIRKALLFILFLKTALTLYDADSDVKLLTDKNFNKFIKRQKITLVEFYAPWCGHCKNLAPEYIKAAKQLKDIIPIAALNADNDDSKQTASKFEIKGFPTLKLFKDGIPSDFHGRTADDIVKYLKNELTDEYITTVTKENIEEFFGLPGPKLIVFGEKEKPGSLLKITSARFYKKMKFGFIALTEDEEQKSFREESAKRLNLSAKDVEKSAAVTLKAKDEDKNAQKLSEVSGPVLKKAMRELLGAEYDDFEKMDIIHDQSCLEKYCIKNSNLCVFLVEAGDKDLIQTRTSILKEARDELVDESYFKFVRVDGKAHEKYLQEIFGKKTKINFPRIFLVSYKKRLFSAFKKPFERDEITKFLTDFVKGSPSEKVMKFKVTELPKMTDESQHCDSPDKKVKPKKTDSEKKESYVFAVTQKSFDEVVKASKVPVIVEFYAPWCGHCKNLAPKYEQAAEKMESAVLFTKIDATNETDLAKKYDVKGYPTIFVSKSQFSREKEDDIKLELYEGGRTTADLLKKAKTLLAEESKVHYFKKDVSEVMNTFEEDCDCKKVIFITDKSKHKPIMNGVSIYFSDEKNLKFQHFSRELKKVVEKLDVKEQRMVIVKKEKDTLKIHLYKEDIEFPGLVRDLKNFLSGDNKAINDHFEFIEKKWEEDKKEL